MSRKACEGRPASATPVSNCTNYHSFLYEPWAVSSRQQGCSTLCWLRWSWPTSHTVQFGSAAYPTPLLLQPAAADFAVNCHHVLLLSMG